MFRFHLRIILLTGFVLVVFLYFGVYLFWSAISNVGYPASIAESVGVIVSQRGNNLPINVKVNLHSHNQLIFDEVSETFINEIFKRKRNNKEKIALSVDSCRGSANIYTWHEICGDGMQNLIDYPLFPHLPTTQEYLPSLDIQSIKPSSGVRLFGYLNVRAPGLYDFLVSSLHVHFKMYFSSKGPDESVFLTDENMSMSQMNLQSQQYYFDIFIKTNTGIGAFALLWRIPGLMAHTLIGPDFLQCFVNRNLSTMKSYDLNDLKQSPLPITFHKKRISEINTTVANLKRSRIYEYTFLPDEDLIDLFPKCPYLPSYVSTRHLTMYEGTWELHYSGIYPDDFTTKFYRLSTNKNQIIFGNDNVSEDIVNKLIVEVVEAIKKKHMRKYTSFEVINIEENPDEKKGSRFFVELEVKDVSEKSFIFSKYIYRPTDSGLLCYPENFQWNKKATVHVIITIGSQGRWANHFIDTMSRIFNETKDPYFNVIIVDFNSQDIDIAKALNRSPLPRYTLIKHSGSFYKTHAIQLAANTIQDANAIILQVDLHVTIPSNFIDHVRKHTVKGKMACSPILFRLQCGATPVTPFGFWETSGYGIFGVYKSDWDTFGGMNFELFKNRWGGEDWELIDRVLMSGLEIERLKVPNFNHIYHSKKGMWDKM